MSNTFTLVEDSRLFHEFPNGQNRPATNVERAESNALKGQLFQLDQQIEKLQRERDALAKGCKHVVFYDEEGWPYDLRYCNACGESRGLV